MPLLLMVIQKEGSVIVAWVQAKIDSFEQKKQDQSNVAAVQSAVSSGDKDALVNAETNLLNGNKPPDNH